MKKDFDLLVFYRKLLAGEHSFGKKPTKLWMKSELLWSGQHYILVREGPYNGQRRTVLLNRESLLLRRGNRDKQPLIALALAAIHPVHKTFPRRELLLHSSRQDCTFGHELFNGLRWSQRLLRDMLFFVKGKDSEFLADEAGWIAEFEEKNAFSNRVLELFETSTGKTLYGTTEKDGYKRPPDTVYRTCVGLDSNASGINVRPVGCSRTVQMVFKSPMEFSEAEFEVFAGALAEIRRMREVKKICTSKV